VPEYRQEDGDFLFVSAARFPDGVEKNALVSELGFQPNKPKSARIACNRAPRRKALSKTTKKPAVVAVFPVDDDSEVIIITQQAKLIRLDTENIRQTEEDARRANPDSDERRRERPCSEVWRRRRPNRRYKIGG